MTDNNKIKTKQKQEERPNQFIIGAATKKKRVETK